MAKGVVVRPPLLCEQQGHLVQDSKPERRENLFRSPCRHLPTLLLHLRLQPHQYIMCNRYLQLVIEQRTQAARSPSPLQAVVVA
jgi:hypothetical protein